MKYKNLILSIMALLVVFAIPSNFVHAQVIQAGCYTRDAQKNPQYYVGPAHENTCPLDANGNESYAYGSNGGAGTIGNGNLKYTMLEPLTVNGAAPSNVCDMLNLIFKIMIYVGAMIAVIFLIIGGIGYMISEVASKRTVARDRIKGAVWGLIMLLTSWIVLNTVNPQLVSACNLVAPADGTGIVSGAAPQSTVILDQVNKVIQANLDPTGTTDPRYLAIAKKDKPTATKVISVLDIDKVNSGAVIIKNEKGTPVDRTTAPRAWAAACLTQYAGATASSKVLGPDGQQVMICYQ